ncbi:MAG: SlyX family protein [Desulfovibrio sp.]|nr:SlyX family protein [Desulfovibrio sp.]
MDMQERLDRLEELCYFQEKRISELNDALTGQQSQIDLLEKKLLAAGEILRVLRENMTEAPVSTLPPHHMPERY